MSARAAWRLETLGFDRVYRYASGKVDWFANGLPGEGRLANLPRVGGLVDADVPTCRVDERLGAVRDRLARARRDLAVVTNDQRVVLGVLSGTALEASPETRVEDVMDAAPTTYRPDALVDDMLKHLDKAGIQRVLITTADGVLLGLLRRDDLERAAQATHANGPVLAKQTRSAGGAGSAGNAGSAGSAESAGTEDSER